jgi:Zn-finger nucleic acid-binding protein
MAPLLLLDVTVMWLTGTSLERIDSALGRSRIADVDRLLAEILAGASSTEPTPTTCAVCRRDLTRSHLNHSPVLIYTCPDGHGSWLDGAGVVTLQRLLEQRATPDAQSPQAPTPMPRASRRIGVLIALLVLSLAGLAASTLTSVPWTGRVTAVPSPMTPAELRYFKALVVVLEDGIMNRRNIDGLLKGDSSPDIYTSSFEIYRARQEQFLRKLDAMRIPARLQPIHARIRTAAERQIGFYRDFKEARVRNASNLPNLLGHPDLRESDYDLHRAWDLIRQTYPVLDPRLAEEIESHICNLDIV